MARIEYIAAHRLEVPQEGDVAVLHVGAAEAAAFHADAVAELSGYVDYLDRLDDVVGRAQPAWWSNEMPAELSQLESCASADDFDAATREAMARLQTNTPRTASSGVVLFLRGERDDGQGFTGVLKMSPVAVDHAQYNPGRGPSEAITVAHLQNVLPNPSDLRKAAVMPNPAGLPLRVIDLQVREPASYWLGFLGAAVAPRPKRTAKALFDTTVSALVDQDVEPADARLLVAAGVEEAARAEEPVAPRQFVEEVATQAEKEPARAWSHAVSLDSQLTNAHVEVPPEVVEDLTTIIDLGGGLTLSGPASQVDPRVTTDMDADGWYVKVRATQKPEPRTR
jgi:nucleoid associated protein NdpA